MRIEISLQKLENERLFQGVEASLQEALTEKFQNAEGDVILGPHFAPYQRTVPPSVSIAGTGKAVWDGWISVEDELPLKPGRYLVCTDTPDDLPYIMRWHRGKGWFSAELPAERSGGSPFRYYEEGVRYWRELPKAKVTATPETKSDTPVIK